MKDQVLQNAMSYTIFFYFASFKPFLCENERFLNLGNFVLVGNKCHIVWKIQISIVINKNERRQFCTPRQKYEIRRRHTSKIRNATLEKVNCTSVSKRGFLLQHAKWIL
jgi:hypothetical protein